MVTWGIAYAAVHDRLRGLPAQAIIAIAGRLIGGHLAHRRMGLLHQIIKPVVL